MNPDAAVEDFAHFAVDLRSTLLTLGSRSKLRLLSLNHRVLAYQDAPLGILGSVACVDADALEFRHTEQDGKPLLKFWREGDNYCVAAFGNGRAAFYLVSPVLIVAPSGFKRVAEILVFRSCQILVVYTSLDVDGALLERLMNLIRIFI